MSVWRSYFKGIVVRDMDCSPFPEGTELEGLHYSIQNLVYTQSAWAIRGEKLLHTTKQAIYSLVWGSLIRPKEEFFWQKIMFKSD